MISSTALKPCGIDEVTHSLFLEALLRGDARTGEQLIRDALDRGVGLKAVYLELFQSALHAVGGMWEQNRISVATEHLVSAVTELLLARIYPELFAQRHTDYRAVVTCVSGELHRIAPRMVADFFELHGWHGFFLGANTPIPDLVRFIRERDPDVVGLSMSLYSSLPMLEKTVAAISNEFSGLEIFIGGQGLSRDSSGEFARESIVDRYPQARYFASLNELEEYLLRA